MRAWSRWWSRLAVLGRWKSSCDGRLAVLVWPATSWPLAVALGLGRCCCGRRPGLGGAEDRRHGRDRAHRAAPGAARRRSGRGCWRWYDWPRPLDGGGPPDAAGPRRWVRVRAGRPDGWTPRAPAGGCHHVDVIVVSGVPRDTRADFAGRRARAWRMARAWRAPGAAVTAGVRRFHCARYRPRADGWTAAGRRCGTAP